MLNKPCSKSSDCGTGICNGAGFCSDTTIIDCCPEGTGNCNNVSCVKPSSKKVNEPFYCVWECESNKGRDEICKLNDDKTSLCSKNSDCFSNECNFDGYCGKFGVCKENGTQNCNNVTCVKPSNKNVGEAYNCVWECKTNNGNGKNCTEKPIIIFFKLISFLVLVFLLYRLGKSIHQKTKGGKIIKQAKQKGGEIIKTANEDANKIKKESLKEQNRIKNETESLISKHNKEIEKINKEKEKIKEKIKDKKLLNEKLEELSVMEELNREEYIKEVKKTFAEITTPRPDPQANNNLVIINPFLGGYKCFYQQGTPLENYPISSLLHGWVWRKHNRKWHRKGYHIHHIDKDKYNNNPKNLEEVYGLYHYLLHKF